MHVNNISEIDRWDVIKNISYAVVVWNWEGKKHRYVA